MRGVRDGTPRVFDDVHRIPDAAHSVRHALLLSPVGFTVSKTHARPTLLFTNVTRTSHLVID